MEVMLSGMVEEYVGVSAVRTLTVSCCTSGEGSQALCRVIT